jgi:hypothetical protein
VNYEKIQIELKGIFSNKDVQDLCHCERISQFPQKPSEKLEDKGKETWGWHPLSSPCNMPPSMYKANTF